MAFVVWDGACVVSSFREKLREMLANLVVVVRGRHSVCATLMGLEIVLEGTMDFGLVVMTDWAFFCGGTCALRLVLWVLNT